MQSHKTYGQFCGLARALDHVGDRWTLLIVRELLIEPRSYKALQDALPGISPNLLLRRVRALIGDGLVVRNDAPARSRAVNYRLSEAGMDLKSVVFELIRWGGRWMSAGPGEDHVDPRWVVLAVRALLDGAEVRAQAGTVQVNADGEWLTLTVTGGRLLARPGRYDRPDATVTIEFSSLLAVASGQQSLDQVPGVRVEGERRLAVRALQSRRPLEA